MRKAASPLDAEGNLKRLTDAMGRVFSYEYDALNRQTKTFYPLVATPFLTLQEVTTGYDANNNVETITETKQTSGGATITDTTFNLWDDFDRLDASTQRGMTIDYGYDANGNRTGVVTVNGSTVYALLLRGLVVSENQERSSLMRRSSLR